MFELGILKMEFWIGLEGRVGRYAAGLGTKTANKTKRLRERSNISLRLGGGGRL